MTDQEILGQIQDTLLEPNDSGATFPSGLWTRDEMVGNLRDAQDRLLKLSAMEIGLVELDVDLGVARVALPEDWLITWNAVWIGDDGTIRELIRSDAFQTMHAHPEWGAQQGTPEVYFDNDQPLLQIQIAPAPNVAGRLVVLYIPSGATIGDPDQAENLSLPDEWVQCAKYGALADAFGKDGRGRSPDRAAYCSQRFDLGVEVAQMVIRSSWVGP